MTEIPLSEYADPEEMLPPMVATGVVLAGSSYLVNWLLIRLAFAPGRIQHRATEVGRLHELAGILRQDRKEEEVRLVLSGVIDGKNAEARAAQLADATREVTERLQEVERDLAKAQIALAYERDHFASLRAMTRTAANGGEDL